MKENKNREFVKKLKQENMMDFEIKNVLAIGNAVFTIEDNNNAHSQMNLAIKLAFFHF